MDGYKKTSVVIIGAGYAGLMTALRLAGKHRPGTAEFTLVNASDGFIERIRNHQVAAGGPIRPHPIRKLLGKRPVKFVQGWVHALDLDERVVHVDVQGESQRIGYDYLVYALGSEAARPALPGLSQHAFGIANAAQSLALRDRLAQLSSGAQVAVIGGGFTGIETATEIAESYPQLQVSLVTAGELGAGLSVKGQTYLASALAQLGIRVVKHTRVDAIRHDAIETGDGGRIHSDASVWAGSFVAPPLAREAGLAVNHKGQVLVDHYLRAVSHPEVFVAGDAAEPVEDPGAPMRMACAVALPMGAHVADNLLAVLGGCTPQPFHFHYTVQCVSLGRRRGLLQFVHGDDSPRERIWTGAMGALAKELICQYAFRSLQLERIAPGAQTWAGKGGGRVRGEIRARQHA